MKKQKKQIRVGWQYLPRKKKKKFKKLLDKVINTEYNTTEELPEYPDDDISDMDR